MSKETVLGREHPDTLRNVRSQSRADQIEVSLNEDIKSREERKMKQRQVQNTTLCAPRPHRQGPSSPVFVTVRFVSSFGSLRASDRVEPYTQRSLRAESLR